MQILPGARPSDISSNIDVIPPEIAFVELNWSQEKIHMLSSRVVALVVSVVRPWVTGTTGSIGKIFGWHCDDTEAGM